MGALFDGQRRTLWLTLQISPERGESELSLGELCAEYKTPEGLARQVTVDLGSVRLTSDARLAQSCLTSRGVAAFHDYGCPSWPDVQPVLDDLFPVLEVFQSVAVHRAAPVMREAYHWLPAKPAPR